MIEPTNKWKAAYVNVVAFATPRCRDVARLLSQSMDRPLPWHQRLRIRWHFTICVWCERYGRQIELLRRWTRASPEHPGGHAHTALPPEARERLAAALREASERP